MYWYSLMNPIRLLGILFILHAFGIAGFVVYRDNQKKVAETNPPTTEFMQGNLSVSTDPTGGRTSPGEVLKRYELSRISSRTIMLVIAAGLGIVGIICTATVSGRE
jgi:hypothetical protein